MHGVGTMAESSENSSMFRKWAMRQYWRMQQSQAVVGLLLWGTTITLLVGPMSPGDFQNNAQAESVFHPRCLGFLQPTLGLRSSSSQ